MQYHAIPCNTSNTMQYSAIQCNTMQYHASLITADGAYHCPVGSIMAIFMIMIMIIITLKRPGWKELYCKEAGRVYCLAVRRGFLFHRYHDNFKYTYLSAWQLFPSTRSWHQPQFQSSLATTQLFNNARTTSPSVNCKNDEDDVCLSYAQGYSAMS